MARAISHFNFSPLSELNLHKRPMIMCLMTTQAQIQDYWASIEGQIEANLKKSIPVRAPIAVFEPMHNLVLAAPKTKAAALCIAACNLIGGDSSRSDTVAAASALQLVHAAGVIHEQLPLTDRPCLNPNIRPVNHHYGADIELLIPDGIVSFALELVARSVDSARNNSGRVLRVIVEISSGVGSLVDGQWNEIEIWGSKFDNDDVWVRRVCRKKEGEMHACGAACGAILGGGSEKEIEKLRKYGLYVGLIEGIMNSLGTRYANNVRYMERVKELRGLALEELLYFTGGNVEPIASIFHARLNDCPK